MNIAEYLTVTDVFSGAGGSTEGLRQSGGRIVVAANHWATAVATHQKNHPAADHRIANLSEVDWRTFPRTSLLWASPSCTWHAPAGGRQKLTLEQECQRQNDGAIDRATAFAVIAAAEVHLYDTVVVENVPEFQNWVLYQWWLDGMRALGYQEHIAGINAADLGMPQRRLRYFAVFTRDDRHVDLTLPAGVSATPATAILDPDPGRPVTRRLYVTPQIEQITERGVPHLVTYRRNARALRADSHPLATVTAGGNHHAVVTIDHDGTVWHRMLNNRERARAQGFPDTYMFEGTSDEVRKQIGNAVPVGVARWLGGRIIASMETAPANLVSAVSEV